MKRQLRIPAISMRGGTSKGVILSTSTLPDCDVDYLFGAGAVAATVIDWSGNCGNLSAAVGANGRRRVDHLSGSLSVDVEAEQRSDGWAVRKVPMSRAARRLMEGWIRAPAT